MERHKLIAYLGIQIQLMLIVIMLGLLINAVNAHAYDGKIIHAKDCGSNIQKLLEQGCKSLGTATEYGDLVFTLDCPKEINDKLVEYVPWMEEGYCWGQGTCGCEHILMTKEEAKNIKDSLKMRFSE